MRRPSATRRTERARLLALVILVLLGPLLTACSDDDPYAGSTPLSGPSAQQQEQRILNQRARAVREHRLPLFLRHVDRSDKALVARQKRYFRNVVQLPFERFTYRVRKSDWSGVQVPARWGEDVRIPQVVLTTQLRDYDAAPVRRTVGFAFSFDTGKPVIVSDQTEAGAPLVDEPAPWDLTRIEVHEVPGVLGVFDRRTEASAGVVTSVVQAGMASLDRALPFSWDRHVVVYDVLDRTVLASFRDVPGGVITQLGAMSFPVTTTPDGGALASTRMLLLPSSVHAGEPFLGRITRHELSHVAIGTRDDGAPVWVSEGIAEYLGARDLSQSQRIIPTSAVSRAQLAHIRLPPSKDFNGTDQEWHYALAWMACDYLAATQGEDTLWRLMDAMHDGGKGTPDRDQDQVLRAVTGMNGRQLARHAAARIRSIYG